jgi:catechol 2,3-dioxygenase
MAGDSATAVSSAGPAPVLPAALRLGPVHLAVTDLDRSTGFYQDVLGLKVQRREDDAAALGVGEDDAAALGVGEDDVVVLHENPQARPAGRHAGLYHYALLYPGRAELARAALRVIAGRVPVQGASDHGTHEAIYLPDPDGNGIELAADRPRAQWPSPEGYAAGPAPLDIESLLAEIEGEKPARHAEPGLRVGHLHLHVGDVDESLRFYRDVVGFELQARLPTAAFVSAGGYHHHLGFNVWRGPGVPPAPGDAVGLHHWSLILEQPEEVEAVRQRLAAAGIATSELERGILVEDPWGIPMAIETGARVSAETERG